MTAQILLARARANRLAALDARARGPRQPVLRNLFADLD